MDYDSCKLRLVRDTRVCAFSFDEAKRYLTDNSIINTCCPFTNNVWEAMQQNPMQDIRQAYDDIAMPIAYAED